MFDKIDSLSRRGCVSKGDIATLCGVSRQTLYNWKVRTPNNRLIAERARNMLALLDKAIVLGFLPLVNIPTGKPRRMAAIKTAMARSANK